MTRHAYWLWRALWVLRGRPVKVGPPRDPRNSDDAYGEEDQWRAEAQELKRGSSWPV